MYNLKYQLDDNDYLAFNKYHFETSAAGKKALLLFRLSIPIIGFMGFLIFVKGKSDSFLILSEAVVLTVFSVLWVAFSKKMYLSSIQNSLKKLRKQGKMPYSAEGTMIFDEEFIRDINPLAEIKTPYSGVEKIGVTEKAIYIYYSSIQAFIVPTACFENETEKQEFLTFLSSKVNVG